MMLLCVEKLVDQEYSREISGSTDIEKCSNSAAA